MRRPVLLIFTKNTWLPRYFSFRLPYLNIPTEPPIDELDKNIQRTPHGLLLKRIQPLPVCAGFFICIRNSLDRPCVTMPSWTSPLKCKVSLKNTDNCSNAPRPSPEYSSRPSLEYSCGKRNPTSAFTWVLMRKKKPVISNTVPFFCFNSTVSYTYLIFILQHLSNSLARS